MGGVGVAPVDLAGDDDEDRRRLVLHRAHLHRRGVGAEQHLGVRLQVEGVLEHPRRVAGRVVERGEVVVVVLDLRAFGDEVAEADHHVLDLPRGAGDQVGVADRPRRRPGQGDVDPVAGEPGSSSVASSAAALPRAAPRAPCAPCWRRRRPCRVPPPAARRSSAGPRQLGFAAEVADPQPLQLVARAGGLDRRSRLGPDLLDPLKHRRPLPHPLARYSRRGGDVQRLGAAGPQGDRRGWRRRRRAPRRAGLRARRRGRRAAPSSASSPAPPWATRAARGPGVAATSARAGGREKIEPMVARRPSGRMARRSRGRARPSRRAARPAVRMIVPTLPGSPTACR